MADGSLKPIEEVQTGEEVLAKDEKSGKIEKKKVTAKFEGKSAVLALTFNNGERLLVTADHPLYVEGQGFRAAQQCGIGTSIVTRAGPSLRVTKVEKLAGVVAVYNFSVEESETYFVGNSGVWAHNCPTDPGNGASVVRGGGVDPSGNVDPERLTNGKGVTTNPDGTLNGVSVESGDGLSIEELGSGVPHNKIGVTTAGAIRGKGGTVTGSPGTSPNHCTVSGISAEDLSGLLSPGQKNPKPKIMPR